MRSFQSFLFYRLNKPISLNLTHIWDCLNPSTTTYTWPGWNLLSIVLTAPLSLVASTNLLEFKYPWIWMQSREHDYAIAAISPWDGVPGTQKILYVWSILRHIWVFQRCHFSNNRRTTDVICLYFWKVFGTILHHTFISKIYGFEGGIILIKNWLNGHSQRLWSITQCLDGGWTWMVAPRVLPLDGFSSTSLSMT